MNFGVRNPKITLKSFSKQKKVLKFFFPKIPYIYLTAHIISISHSCPTLTKPILCQNESYIPRYHYCQKSFWTYLCMICNTIILLIILNHFCSSAFNGVLSYHLIENKLEFGVSGSIKNQSLLQFCSKKCSYNTGIISDFNKNVAIYLISHCYKMLIQMPSLSHHGRCLLAQH